jgi:hypothetical protein
MAAKLEFKDLSVPDWLVVGTAVAALFSLFLPWYGIEYLGVGDAVGGFSSGFGLWGALLIAGTGGLLLVLRSGRRVPVEVVLATSFLGTVLVAIRCLTIGSVEIGNGTSLSFGPRVGIVVALLAGLVQAFGAVLLLRREARSTEAPSTGDRPPPDAQAGASAPPPDQQTGGAGTTEDG